MRLAGKRIVLGVTGSIAAYKAVLLLRQLQQAGAQVRVILTPAATKFIAPLTFQALSHHPVYTDVWAEAGEWSAHVQWGQWTDLLVVAPCTANTLAKLATGACDDALTAVALSAACPLLVAPAMDGEMYAHAATQANLNTLQIRGVQVVPPGTGYLASGLEGQGRMAEPETIVEAVVAIFGQGALAGKRILVSAGPTQEAIDPVRYISNHSSGKMGLALAQAALAMGAQVTLVAGPLQVAVPQHPNLTTLPITNAAELLSVMTAQQALHDAIIMAAAVADYRPVVIANQKLKKQAGVKKFTLELETTEDVLATLGKQKPKGQLLVGFALETQDELANAQKKLESKNLDMIVLNSLRDAGVGFGLDTNQVTLLHRDGSQQHIALKSKREIAQDILAVLALRLGHA